MFVGHVRHDPEKFSLLHPHGTRRHGAKLGHGGEEHLSTGQSGHNLPSSNLWFGISHSGSIICNVQINGLHLGL